MASLALTALLCLLASPSLPLSTDTVAILKSDSLLTDREVRAGIEPSGSGMAQVRMSHEAHARKKVRCGDCHHKKANDDRIKQCAKCHKGAPAQKAMHGACVTCHEKRKKGPVDCERCHTP